MYLTTCKIGHHVEVHLKNGSVYSGIFHAVDVENNFGEALNGSLFLLLRCDLYIRRRHSQTALELSGIILKMASLIKEGSSRGMKPRAPLVSKPPSKTFIIPTNELVQVVAKVHTLILQMRLGFYVHINA